VCSKCGTNREEYNESKRREEEERQRKQKEWEQSPEGKAKVADQKRKEDEQGKKITYYLFAIPLIGLLYYFIFKELFDSSLITIIISAISGVISSYILYDEIF
jgi:F0F1-type ATP synthase assembly protein I